jgi:hypothetical protein
MQSNRDTATTARNLDYGACAAEHASSAFLDWSEAKTATYKNRKGSKDSRSADERLESEVRDDALRTGASAVREMFEMAGYLHGDAPKRAAGQAFGQLGEALTAASSGSPFRAHTKFRDASVLLRIAIRALPEDTQRVAS